LENVVITWCVKLASNTIDTNDCFLVDINNKKITYETEDKGFRN